MKDYTDIVTENYALGSSSIKLINLNLTKYKQKALTEITKVCPRVSVQKIKYDNSTHIARSGAPL